MANFLTSVQALKFLKNFKNRDGGRNETPIEEMYGKALDAMETASREMNQAINFYKTRVRLFRLSTLPKCSCTMTVRDKEIKFREAGSILDFLLKKELSNESYDECPICLGTGRKGGFVQFGCYTNVLDASNLADTNMYVKRTEPFKLSFNGNCYVKWKVRIPAHFTKVNTLCLRFENDIPSFKLFINDIQISSLKDINQFSGQKVDLKLEVDCDDPNIFFLMIYLSFVMKEDGTFPCDLPRETKSFTGDFNIPDELEPNITANFGIENDEILTSDFMVTQSGYIYRIMSVENFNPFGKHIAYITQCRLVREFERYTNVPDLQILKAYHKSNYDFHFV